MFGYVVAGAIGVLEAVLGWRAVRGRRGAVGGVTVEEWRARLAERRSAGREV